MGSTRRGFWTLTKLSPRYTPEAARLIKHLTPELKGMCEPLSIVFALTLKLATNSSVI